MKTSWKLHDNLTIKFIETKITLVTVSVSRLQSSVLQCICEKMAFAVVQTRKTKKSKPILTIVPSKWIVDNQVWWPPNNFISLSTNESTVPEFNVWTKQVCKIVGRAKTYKLAEDEVNRLEMVTDSEDAVNMTQGTRGHPPKKKAKFVSKSYTLEPPVKKAIMVS